MSDSEYTPAPSWIKQFQAALMKSGYRGINRLLAIWAVVLWPRRRPQTAERVLIYRVGNIGDITCALPAIRAVRRAYPTARLTLLTSPGPLTLPGAKDLLPDVDWIDDILVYGPEDITSPTKCWRLAMRLRRERFDVWMSLPMSLTTLRRELRDMIFAKVVGVGWGRGWAISTMKWAAQAQSEYLECPGEVDRLLAVVARTGFSSVSVEFGLPRSKAACATVDGLLSMAGISDWVALAPGCKRSTNRWPAERFAEVGTFVASRGVGVVLIGGAGDVAECDHIATTIGDGAFSLAGKLDLPESIEVLRRCRLVVCVDSGIQHLAGAVGTPTISLFSFWQMRGKWHPYGIDNVVLQKWVPCHTCLLTECFHENRCMKAIETGEVIRHVADKLARGRTRLRVPDGAASRCVAPAS